MSAPKPVILCILDGFGHREETAYNAIAQAHAPTWKKLWATSPHALLTTDGLSVGLPEGQMGNSEVGHMTMGAGRVLMQDLPRIDLAIKDGALAKNPILLAYIAKLKASGGTCHLMGLCSNGGVHAHESHIVALAQIITQAGVPVALHAFTDGRDVAPQSALETLPALEARLPHGATIASLSGRYYAMDRDKRWERVEQAFRAIVEGQAVTHFDSVKTAIAESYARGEHDEFIKPMLRTGYAGMNAADGLLFANFRADRARELLQAVLDPAFESFTRPALTLAAVLGMVEYSDRHRNWMPALFPPKELTEVLGEVVSLKGKTQLRLAETEKYAHVTFFLNGGEETVYAGEERILVPSPKVATYDLQPEMSADEVTSHAVTAIESGKFDLIVMNYANADMVGHSGKLDAAIKAVEAVDVGLTAILAAVEKAGGALMITADHGNCEEMWDEANHGPHTAHSMNPVPVVLWSAQQGISLHNGGLADIAPTVLELMQIEQPAAMTGQSLINKG